LKAFLSSSKTRAAREKEKEKIPCLFSYEKEGGRRRRDLSNSKSRGSLIERGKEKVRE